MQANLEQAKNAVADLEAQLVKSSDEIEQLTDAVKTLEAQSATDTAAHAAELEAAQAKLSEALDEVSALSAQLDGARADYQKLVDELAAYMLSRDLSAGEAHSATSAADVIEISADGVTGKWTYVNEALSGNTVVLSILVGEEELYHSEPIAPGEALEEITLSRTLTAGEYDAVAVTAIYDADGSSLFANRVPVKLSVAE